ncbi:hypothetical protein AV947_gp05 [Podophage Lau218]|uniref:Putative phage protein n=2 Tax=Lauvirus lau218 TaxID=1465639 RepID=A0A060BGT3_9CAUD|nr:hypothetical protein AV947_gp05 [Podophage Lau218]AIA83120.1 putative phage protein [Podophage Lau218]AIA83168.1 putative phage protein [Lauvirus lau218]AIA83216.1 putative phage protein [Lauvirus lau218]
MKTITTKKFGGIFDIYKDIHGGSSIFLTNEELYYIDEEAEEAIYSITETTSDIIGGRWFEFEFNI